MPLNLAGSTQGARVEQSGAECFWVLHTAASVTVRQAHAISRRDWQAGVARAACGLPLGHDTIGNIPSGGVLPCGRCLAATAGIVGLESI